ncbi:hypothetical protein ACFCWG_05365 [Streptomyces sp. NPDC056390]|uniref:hypothetical protein n=1 Tax=Streptomyces sp. NPDC056390 TaxID=3345806 RepID=UPI0035D72F1E
MTRRRLFDASAAAVLGGGGVGGWLMYGRNAGGRTDGTVPLWDGAPGQVPEPVWSVSGLDPDMPFGPASARGLLPVVHPGRVPPWISERWPTLPRPRLWDRALAGASAANRLHLSCATTVVTLPAVR